MGLLSLGTPLEWEVSRKYNEHVRDNGVEQLIYIFKAAHGRNNDPLYWGDELEFMLVTNNHKDNKKEHYKLSVEADWILESLESTETPGIPNAHDQNVTYHPEYGRFMLEATPLSPYNSTKEYSKISYVEKNMELRRQLAEEKLSTKDYNHHEKVILLSIAVFPRMGCDNFINVPNQWDPLHKNKASQSLFLPDEIINRHVRFPTLTANIRTRRGEKVAMNVPMYKDIHTPLLDDSIENSARIQTFGKWFPKHDSEKAYKPGFIYMDAMGFGMGCSCLQVTFQAPNLEMGRYLYDSLNNFAPIMLSLTSASPFFKGWLSDQDVRWNVISGAVDDRTAEEKDSGKVPKSRYSVVDLYLGSGLNNKASYFDEKLNDTNVPINKKVYQRLLDNEIYPMDKHLARHFAHLFIRDPIVIFEERINQDNETETDHFENIQSTNWQSLRFKPPTQKATPDNKQVPGWRVEFRTMEIQLTSFENAAFSILIYLIVECLLTFPGIFNAYIPMSNVWQNMETAHKRDSTISPNIKFHWKTQFFNTNSYDSEKMTMKEIFNNPKSGIFPVVINRILKHKKIIDNDWKELKARTEDSDLTALYFYLLLVEKRSSGEIPTFAHYFRNFVLRHPEYKHDSKISESINDDLIDRYVSITNLDNENILKEYFGDSIGEYLYSKRENKI
ncbi:glutamate--cysteine ligase SCDLUD_003664 [Saccharomycodes ludwigii]|uniref:glutamate--cysteine ligase n=1 Tax=Saccharomycodes ludwigii TaxID=36035 RepID=UPI001E88FAE3|nr:hypothetical protein SCDLUD_003664 [Saccharomycodes ludwigii]KAH3900666.1 hypothetical protein SCDLUD_003664 [Saccharomycodes ludwigii]